MIGQPAYAATDGGFLGEERARQGALPFAVGTLGFACFWRMLRYDAIRALFPFGLFEQTGVSWYYYGLLAAALVATVMLIAVRPLAVRADRPSVRFVLAVFATVGAAFLSVTTEVEAVWIMPVRCATVTALACCFVTLARGWLQGCCILLRRDARGGVLAVTLSSMVALLFSMAFYVDASFAAALRAFCPLGSALCLGVLEKKTSSLSPDGKEPCSLRALGKEVWYAVGFVALCFVIASVIRHTGPVGQERAIAAPELIGNYFFTLIGGVAGVSALLFVERPHNLAYSLVLIPVAMLSLGYFSFGYLGEENLIGPTLITSARGWLEPLLFTMLAMIIGAGWSRNWALAAFVGVEIVAGILRRLVAPVIAWHMGVSFDVLSQQASMALCFVLMACCIGTLVVLLVRGGRARDDAGPSNQVDVANALAQQFGLTPREAVIAGYLVRGYTSPAIAKAQDLSLSTVQTHTRSIYGKVGVHSRQELIEVAEKLK